MLNTDKELKLYYSIGEVADMFGVNQSLLPFLGKGVSTDLSQNNGKRDTPVSQRRCGDDRTNLSFG